MTVNYREESAKSDSGNGNGIKPMESASQKIINYPSVLAGLSREIRTQMNAIVAFSFLQNNNDFNTPEKEEFSNQIYDACEMIITLLDNFLDSAIIDTGDSKCESGNYYPDKIFDTLFSEFREVLRKEKHKDLDLVVESQPSNPGEYLIDTNRVTRVIRNLFQNSVNNTKSGYIKTGFSFSDNTLTFHILDSGEAFEKCREFLYTRDLADSLSKYNDIYAAINLTLTRKLIQVMGGSVWIEKNGLSGTGLYFSIPVIPGSKTENNNCRKSNTLITI